MTEPIKPVKLIVTRDLKEKINLINDFYSSMFKYLPNPTRLLNQQGDKVFSETMADTTVHSAINTIVEGVSSYEWDIVANDNNEDIVNIYYKTAQNLLNQNIIKKILNALFIGFNPLNVVWKDEGKHFVIDKVYELPYNNVKFDKDNNLFYFKDTFALEGIQALPYQILPVTYDTSYNNPYGMGLLLYCYKYVFFKTNILEFWIMFAEEFGTPLLSATYDANAVKANNINPVNYANEILDTVLNTRKSKVVVQPNYVELNSLNTGSTTSSDIFAGIVQLCNSEITKLLLGHNAGSEATAGKLGNETMAEDNKFDRIESYKNFVENYINVLFSWQHQINFNSEFPCEIRLYQKDDIDKYAQKANLSMQLKELGVVFNKSYIAEEFQIKEDFFEMTDTMGADSNNKELTNDVNDTSTQRNLHSHKHFFNAEDPLIAESVKSLLLSEKFAKDVLTDKVFNDALDKQYTGVADFIGKYDNYDDMLNDIYTAFDDINVEDMNNVMMNVQLISSIVGHQGGVDDATNQ